MAAYYADSVPKVTREDIYKVLLISHWPRLVEAKFLHNGLVNFRSLHRLSRIVVGNKEFNAKAENCLRQVFEEEEVEVRDDENDHGTVNGPTYYIGKQRQLGVYPREVTSG